MSRRRLLVPIALSLATLVWPMSKGTAHPHVWIDAVVSPRFEQGAIVALEIAWAFDEFYSAVVAEDFDANGDNELDKSELKLLADVSRGSLADYNYFTYVYLDGAAIETQVANLTARLEAGVIHYDMEIALPRPVKPAEQSLAFSLYDESFYVDVSLNQIDPVRFIGEGSEACHFALVEDKNRPFYFGMVYPTRVDVHCGIS